MYAELGPQKRPTKVMPPAMDNNVQYTSLNHDKNAAKQIPLDSPGIIIIQVLHGVSSYGRLFSQYSCLEVVVTSS